MFSSKHVGCQRRIKLCSCAHVQSKGVAELNKQTLKTAPQACVEHGRNAHQAHASLSMPNGGLDTSHGPAPPWDLPCTSAECAKLQPKAGLWPVPTHLRISLWIHCTQSFRPTPCSPKSNQDPSLPPSNLTKGHAPKTYLVAIFNTRAQGASAPGGAPQQRMFRFWDASARRMVSAGVQEHSEYIVHTRAVAAPEGRVFFSCES